MEFFLGKTILITGATGFLAKGSFNSFSNFNSHVVVISTLANVFPMPAVLLEKILRTQPNIKKIFLLIRAKDSESARQRFNNEVKHNC